MNLLLALIIGALAGWAAGEVMRGHGFGLLGNIVVGIVGALVGSLLFGLLGFQSTSIVGSLISAFVGSVVLLAIVGAIRSPATY
jgi:uncharacterized membrane protein YeaQ/YmgE (transglycosylase-associated protein family)